MVETCIYIRRNLKTSDSKQAPPIVHCGASYRGVRMPLYLTIRHRNPPFFNAALTTLINYKRVAFFQSMQYMFSCS